MYSVFCVSVLVALFAGGLTNVMVLEASSEMDVNLDSDTRDWSAEMDAGYGDDNSDLGFAVKVNPTEIQPGYLDCPWYLYRTVEETLKVSNGGERGKWGKPCWCPRGSYAAGYKMKIESVQGSGDDTSLNGIKLICKDTSGKILRDITSKVGPWGRWDEVSTSCHGNDFMTSFRLQVERNQGIFGDDTAANFVMFKCRGLKQRGEGDDLVRPPGRGLYGNWGHWSKQCKPGTAICGIKTKVENQQHFDDTALNDVKFFCCK